MTPSPPNPFHLIYILAKVGLRRSLNRMSHVLFRGLRKRRRAAAHTKRRPTPRKRGTNILLASLMGIMIVFGALSIAYRLIRNLADQVDSRSTSHPGQIAVSQRVFKNIVRREKDLMEIEATIESITQGSDHPLGQEEDDRLKRSLASKEALRKSLESQFGSEARKQMRHGGDTSELEKRLMEKFEREGSGGFYAVKNRFHDPWGGVDLWPRRENERMMILAAGALLSALAVTIVLNRLGGKTQDLGKVEWDAEWLFTFPASGRVLFLAQILQSALVNTWSWFTTFPVLFVLFWIAGYRGWALPLGLVMTLYVNLILGSVHVLVETWLRKTLAPSRLKNFQAGFTIIGAVCFFGLMFLAYAPSIPEEVFNSLQTMESVIVWLPCSLPAMLCRNDVGYWGPLVAMVLFSILIPLGAIWGAQRLVRDGLIKVGGPYQGPRVVTGRPLPPPRLLRGVLGKELRLLMRDRNFFAQTLIIPLLIIAAQIIINPTLLRGITRNHQHLFALAFGIGAYVLMFGGFQVLASEGKSLWLLYTFPRRLEAIMRQKALLWSVLGSIYTVGFLTVTWTRWVHAGPTAFLDAGMAVVGVFIYAFIAAAIGVMGTNPLEVVVRRRIRPGMMYLYMLLAGLYAYGIYAPSLWQKLGQVTLCCLVAYAIWQKVRDRAPFLLDPTQSPPPRISLSDGLIAAFAFFVLQGIILLGFQVAEARSTTQMGGQLFIAYVAAGALVTAVSVLIFLGKRVPKLGDTVGISKPSSGTISFPKAALIGLVAGGAAAGFALVYLEVIEFIEPLRVMKQEASRLMQPTGGTSWYFVVILAVLAAPVFEEYLFRGLVFTGLRRSVRPGTAVLGSAAIFAVIHPPISLIPVFVLGVVAAVSFKRTGVLITPIIAHTAYNAVVVFGAF